MKKLLLSFGLFVVAIAPGALRAASSDSDRQLVNELKTMVQDKATAAVLNIWFKYYPKGRQCHTSQGSMPCVKSAFAYLKSVPGKNAIEAARLQTFYKTLTLPEQKVALRHLNAQSGCTNSSKGLGIFNSINLSCYKAALQFAKTSAGQTMAAQIAAYMAKQKLATKKFKALSASDQAVMKLWLNKQPNKGNYMIQMKSHGAGTLSQADGVDVATYNKGFQYLKQLKAAGIAHAKKMNRLLMPERIVYNAWVTGQQNWGQFPGVQQKNYILLNKGFALLKTASFKAAIAKVKAALDTIKGAQGLQVTWTKAKGIKVQLPAELEAKIKEYQQNHEAIEKQIEKLSKVENTALWKYQQAHNGCVTASAGSKALGMHFDIACLKKSLKVGLAAGQKKPSTKPKLNLSNKAKLANYYSVHEAIEKQVEKLTKPQFTALWKYQQAHNDCAASKADKKIGILYDVKCLKKGLAAGLAVGQKTVN